MDLAPGERGVVELTLGGVSFDWWTAHAEVGSSAPSSGGDQDTGHRGEHDLAHEYVPAIRAVAGTRDPSATRGAENARILLDVGKTVT